MQCHGPLLHVPHSVAAQMGPVCVAEMELDAWLGGVGVGMGVVDVVLFGPATPGGSQHSRAKAITPALVAGLRVGPIKGPHAGITENKLGFTGLPTLCRDGPKLYELPSGPKQAPILSGLLIDGSYVAERVEGLQDTQDSSGGAWACAHCTYVNVTAQVRCGICRKARVE